MYTYFGYPAALFLGVRLRGTKSAPLVDRQLPSVSVVISVYNEEKVLEERIRNLENSLYPKDKIEFLFGSDASTDGTDTILSKMNSANLRAFRFDERRGKSAVLNDLVTAANGEVIVFTDANTVFTDDTVEKLVRAFADPAVGAVCGNLILHADPKTVGGAGESAYWTYENYIKRLESDLMTVVGATGGVYAIRRQLYHPLPTGKPVTDDFVVPLKVLEAGYTAKYEEQALAYERSEDSVLREFRRKARISAQNYSSLSEFSALLHPRKGFIAFALWSHKIVRWMVPFLMLLMLLSSILLASNLDIYRLILYSELFIVAVAVTGFILDLVRFPVGWFGIPYYFFATNAALLVGFVRFLFNRERPMWEINR
jgi:biofilm PGA synthesis N-glycosyltransferase PgaC